jgi:hypothetical protein
VHGHAVADRRERDDDAGWSAVIPVTFPGPPAMSGPVTHPVADDREQADRDPPGALTDGGQRLSPERARSTKKNPTAARAA